MINNNFRTFSSYIKDYDITPNEEDYIEMIYRSYINTNSESITVKELAKLLNIKAPSVSKMINKLCGKNIVIREKYGLIYLTEIGSIIGHDLLNRHNVLEQFITIIGCTENILETTEKIEHLVDENLLKNIERLIIFLKSTNYKMS